jgi:hypothetical protein
MGTLRTVTAAVCMRYVAFRYETKHEQKLLGLLRFKLWLDRNKMANSCVLGGPISQTERTLCHIHCRETPNSLKLLMFLVASVRHCLQRMERLQYIMQSFGRFLSAPFVRRRLFIWLPLLRSLLRFIILSWFQFVFFVVPHFSLCFVVFVFFPPSSDFLMSLFLLVGWNYCVLNWAELNDVGYYTITHVF